MGLATVKDIDEVLHRSLKTVEVFALKKEEVQQKEDLTEEEKVALMAEIRDPDGTSIDDLCLDFLLPGTGE